MENDVIQVDSKKVPELVQLFTHLLWANSPKDWILKSTYFQGTLFISMLISTPEEDQYQKIRRSFGIETINLRSEDIWGLAADCIDQMKTEVKQ